ncbi:hypothetical protein C1H46_037298 [Malus baccata]|uniref:Uncharacterized protein n=1 Tax=Malus baccata TaxID=106549 RepID=A0A540KT19_MALBA|nr:hypothetical protein C1H46_037298 [Malus baccata]
MSSKWRAIQHRHRYTYNTVVFPATYTDSLNSLPPQIATSKFFSLLKELVSLNSTYAQLNHTKGLAAAFGDVLASGDEALVSEAAAFYLELLFLENSLPLHKTLVSVLAKARTFQALIRRCYRRLCEDYGGGRGKRFCVSRSALSVMGMPKLGFLVEIVEECAVLIACDTVSSLDALISETKAYSRPSPIVMEQCQEALSCLYYLLQRFPSKFEEFNGGSDNAGRLNVLEMSVTVVLSVLKSVAFSRDCYVAAGVSFCAALQVCLGPEELGLFIIEGIFHPTDCISSLDANADSERRNAIAKLPYKGDMYTEIRSLSDMSRLCLIRGILTAVSRAVLNTHFDVSKGSSNGYESHTSGGNCVKTILYDGILPELCNYCENPTDSHFNFHALTVLQICLQQIKTSMLANLTITSEDYDPIPVEMGTRILRIVWNNLEDPLSQTVKQVHLIFDLFLDIRSTLRWSEGSERIRSFLQSIASDLLRLGPRCKGRYVPLGSLTKRLGAKTMLDMSPGLLFQTAHAYIDDDVCCALTLCKLTESWMEQLMDRTVAKGQTVDDLLRRSAGIPAAFIALFLSEPEGAPKKLLPRALRWLIDVANASIVGLVETNSSNGDMGKLPSIKSGKVFETVVPSDMDISNKVSKIRDEGVIPTVHAFNVLRAAFNDTNLAADTSGFSAEAMIVSVRSFSSPHWEVRNSACLAYTALVRRMIGFLNVQKRESSRRALTGVEFFHRYPLLHPFLIKELKAATVLLGDGISGQSEPNLENAVHPSLCPVLILLSRLKPSTIASETGDDVDPFLLMPFIRKCSTQSNLRVRVLASRALAGLVSNEKLPSVLLNIVSELPRRDDQATWTPELSLLFDKTERRQQSSYNWIHGILLQLSSLLDTNCRNLADSSKKDQILGDLFQALLAHSWIGKPRLCPCPILNASFLNLLDHMLSIARTCHTSKNVYALRNLLLELSTECLDVKASNGRLYYDPTMAELRQQAAVSYFSCVFQASDKMAEDVFQTPQRYSQSNSRFVEIPEMENSFAGLQERLVRSLSDSEYEVRLATLKWLLKLITSTESGHESHDNSSEIRVIQHWVRTNLQTTLVNLLDMEKYHRCSYYILRILFNWNTLQFQKLGDAKCTETIYVGSMDCDSVFLLWDKLISLYKFTRHAKARQTLICCFGICIKRFAGLLTTSVLSDNSDSDRLEKLTRLYGIISFFTNVIMKHSASSEPINMRMAAAESIIASGLLEQAELIGYTVFNNQIPSENPCSTFEPKEAVNLYAHQILDIWFTCIQLLEDEDDEIRERLAMGIQGCFTSKRSGSSHGGVVPTQVEKVIGSCFEHLSSVFGHWIGYFDYLLRWVLNASNREVPKGDLVRQVFDKEIDNHHEEKLFICQLCCSQLDNLQISKSWAADFRNKQQFSDYLHDWRLRFSCQLTSFSKDRIAKLGGADWVGGAGNHKDAFLPLYANLLAFYALSNCIFNGKTGDNKHLQSDVAKLGKAINPFLRNPLISNLYLLVVKSHEDAVGSNGDDLIPKLGEGAVWEGFNPHFLLR